MGFKRTDNCCRVCKHRGWGKSKKHQQYDGIVCLLKPKTFADPVDNIEPHYYATTMIRSCENFERRNEQ